MKKTRIIIPALAMIAFSVAASITGTVAWFTANRTAQIEAGSFTVVKTSSNLDVTLAPGVGTTVDNDADTVTVNNKMTDGSVQHLSTPTIYTPAESGTELAATNGSVAVSSASESNMLRGIDEDDQNIYTAVTYQMSFTLTFGASQKDVGLYLDCTANHSRFEVTGPASTKSTPSTAKGFRMAFIPNASGDANARVFADLQTAANCKHLDGSITSGWAAGNNYGGIAYDNDLIDSAYSTALPTSGNRSAYQSRPDYLGTFEFADADANHQVTLTFYVVCWFEGTDPEIVNREHDDDYQTVASYLHFEAKDLPAA
jgi:hypothetical protein